MSCVAVNALGSGSKLIQAMLYSLVNYSLPKFGRSLVFLPSSFFHAVFNRFIDHLLIERTCRRRWSRVPGRQLWLAATNNGGK